MAPESSDSGGPLPPDEVKARLDDVEGWSVKDGAVEKEYSFSTFTEAVEFVNAVAREADAADHHPDIDIRYNKVRLALVTHSAGGITPKDVDMAHRIEERCRPSAGGES